ncbi:MAG: DNA helicase RecQ, partial [Bacteroidales bacterium]|nr:DNA helicase RecQ [Bacteroidales bacterium]
MTEQLAGTALKKYFGYDSFRPLQNEVIASILGKRDTLVVMPSGGGKSVCFQVPSVISEGATVVISPLIALMKDQVEGLISNGITAAYINSSLSSGEQKNVFGAALEGALKLLYVSPERILKDDFLSFLKKIQINFFAVDEAHCISAWGHDFRPEYAQLSLLRPEFPDLPVMALTATADKITRRDICKQLNLVDPEIFISSFDRPNLSLNVFPAKNRFKMIRDYINSKPGEPGIIYCLSRKSTEQLAARLTGSGIPAIWYHAGMKADERNKAQDEFINDNVTVICATIAFGMGIDKSNVRWVIHYNLPKNLESYYQEIGRAGRDGLPSDTMLFYTFGDIVTLRGFAKNSGQPDIQLAKLERMQQFAEAPTCRRKILLSYFNENLEEDCGNCDVCGNPPNSFDGTIVAQKALSAIFRLKESVPSGLLIDVLRGSGKREIFQNGFHKIKTYGSGKDFGYFDWQQYLLQMLHQGLFEIAYDENRNLKLTELSHKVLFQGMKVNLVRFSEFEQFTESRIEKIKRKTKQERLEDGMFEKLKILRKQLAESKGVPAYVIFSDKNLKEMAFSRPATSSEMLEITGVGEHKLELYGDVFLNEIVKFKLQEGDRGSTHLET